MIMKIFGFKETFWNAFHIYAWHLSLELEEQFVDYIFILVKDITSMQRSRKIYMYFTNFKYETAVVVLM